MIAETPQEVADRLLAQDQVARGRVLPGALAAEPVPEPISFRQLIRRHWRPLALLHTLLAVEIAAVLLFLLPVSLACYFTRP